MLNLTQHPATPEQAAAGVVAPANVNAVRAALTFETVPDAETIRDRAETLATIAAASGERCAMIGGAPFFMSALERALVQTGVTPVYAFSVRETEEQTLADGSVRKVAVFRHAGFVPAVIS